MVHPLRRTRDATEADNCREYGMQRRQQASQKVIRVKPPEEELDR